MFEEGDTVEWVHVSHGRDGGIGMTKVSGVIHEIKGDKARCRRGKKGKVDHWVKLKHLHPPGSDPLRDIVHIMAEVHRAN